MINLSSINTIVPVNNNLVATSALHFQESFYDSNIKYHYFEHDQLKSFLSKHSRNFMKIGLHNARSLIGNIENYRSLLANSALDVLAIVETWLKPSITNKLAEIAGYAIVRSDRRNRKKRGGGVAFYLKKNVKYSVITKSEKDSEIDYLFIKLKHANLVCGVIYKPPNIKVSNLNCIFNTISELSSTEPNILVMGDFNINLKAQESKKCTTFLENLNALSFKLISTSPTCHRTESSSILDLFTGNCTKSINNVYQSSLGRISDHDFICVDYKYKHSKSHPEVYWAREYHKIDNDSFLSDLHDCAFDRVFCCANVNDKLRCFYEMFFDTLNRLPP